MITLGHDYESTSIFDRIFMILLHYGEFWIQKIPKTKREIDWKMGVQQQYSYNNALKLFQTLLT